MTLKTIVTTVLVSLGFLVFGIGLGKVCTAITVMAVCGGAIITLAGFALIIIGGFMTLS